MGGQGRPPSFPAPPSSSSCSPSGLSSNTDFPLRSAPWATSSSTKWICQPQKKGSGEGDPRPGMKGRANLWEFRARVGSPFLTLPG